MEMQVYRGDTNLKLYDIGLDSSREDMSVSDFMRLLDKFKFNDPIQRNTVWTIAKKSLAIISVIEKVHIGEVKIQVIRKHNKKIRNVVDGKQRLTTIRDFILNKFALKNVPYVKGYDENENEILIDFNGLKYQELPEVVQERIKSYMLEIKIYEIDDEVKKILFFRWNNGESLKAAEKRKSIMPQELLEFQSSVKALPVMKEGLLESQLNRDVNGEMVLQYLLLLKDNLSSDLGAKTIDALLNQLVNEELLETAEKNINYLNEVYKTMNKETRQLGFNKIKTQASLCVTKIALEKNIEPQNFGEWIETFYINPETKNKEFIEHSSKFTTKKATVEKRIALAIEDFNCFVNEKYLL